jgi:drug/metabolite transporter (DMT)-like permease
MWRIWAAALFWGLNFPTVKTLLSVASPWTLRAAGLAAGTLVLAATTLAMRKSLVVPRRHWLAVAVGGLLSVAAFNVLAAFAQMTLTASRSAILTYTMPLWSVLFAWIALAEPIDRLRAAALSLGAGGIVLLAAPFWPSLSAGVVPPGLAFVLGSAIVWAAGTVFLRWARPEADPMALTTWQLAVGATAAGLGMLAFETPRLDLSNASMQAVFAYHAVFPQGIAYALWFALIARVGASTAALGTLLVPVFAVAASALLLGERLGLLDWAGFALILSGVVLDQGMRGWLSRGEPPRPA